MIRGGAKNKRAGKALEREIEGYLLKLTDQTRQDDISKRTHRIRNSGGDFSDKGDIITLLPFLEKQFLIECKRRKSNNKKEGPFIDIPFEWLDKIIEEANHRHCYPLIVFSFTGRKDNRLHVLLPQNVMDVIFKLLSTGYAASVLDNIPIVKNVKKPYFRLTQSVLIRESAPYISLRDFNWSYMSWSNFYNLLIKLKFIKIKIPENETFTMELSLKEKELIEKLRKEGKHNV